MDIKTLTSGDFIFQIAHFLVTLPKTLKQVILNPSWIPDYIEEELQKEQPNQFNNYIPPIRFWLVIGVFSYLAILMVLVQNSADKATAKLFNDLSPWLLGSGFILFLPIPLSIAFVLQILKYKEIEKSSFKRTFLIQCYCTAPLQLFYIFMFLLTEGDDLTSVFLNLLSTAGVLSGLIWFIICETRIIKKELNAGTLKVIGVFVLMYISSWFFMLIGIVLFVLFNYKSLGTLADGYFNSIGIP
jgi:hypothetical protein